MTYNLVTFLSGATGTGYQELDNGAMTRLTDIDGNLITDDVSYTITQADVPTPVWGTP